MRGRPRKPRAVLEAEGTFRADRHANRGVAMPAGTPERPSWVKGESRKLWDSIVPLLSEAGIITAADGPSLSAMCQWWGMWRRLDKELQKDDYDWRVVNQAAVAWDKFAKLAARYGMTPADRERLKGGAPKTETNPLLELAKIA